MRDDQLLQDLSSKQYAQKIIETLQKNNITTYSQLFLTLKDTQSDPKIIYDGCYALFYLSKEIDKRRAVPPLLTALKSNDADARGAAALALGHLGSKRAVLPLIDLLSDQNQPWSVRHWVIDALSSIDDERALKLFWEIIDDPAERPEIRSRAIEMLFERPEPVERLIALFSDPVPDIRFWAAYALSYIAPPEALSELDRIVAYDHTLPRGWGWHIDREAMLGLETIYYRKLLGFYDTRKDEDYPWYGMGCVYLVSPAPEYDTLAHEYRQRGEDGHYFNKALPEMTLRVEANWLAEKLREKWPEINLNVRDPRPRAYVLDWHLAVGEDHLTGALHRDHYGIVLTGVADEMIYSFAAWYRGLLSAEQRLGFYEWADYEIPLPAGISGDELGKIIDQRHEQRLTWKPASDDSQEEVV